jgi:calcium-dependent protein kinase
MHRDLKPDNIILKKKDVGIKDNIVKLVDFGLATYQDLEEYLFKRCGTPGFVAPEVINAKKGVNVKY